MARRGRRRADPERHAASASLPVRVVPRGGHVHAWPLAIIMPLAYAVLGGLRTTGELLNRPFDLPTDWWPHNYIDRAPVGGVLDRALQQRRHRRHRDLHGGRPCRRLAAFAFARIKFPGREAIYTLFVLGLLFPAAVAILPLFILIRQLDAAQLLVGRGAAAGGLRACPSRSSSCARSSGPSPSSWRMPPASMAAARSASSGGSRCRSRARRSPRSPSSPSSAAGTRSCCRCWSCGPRTSGPCRLG